jgi:phage terminase small subunit
MQKLTPKQEKFAQSIASGMSQAAAYRESDNLKPTKSMDAIHIAASVLASDGRIVKRIAELRAPIIKKVGITLENHLNELQILRDLAKNDAKYGPAIQAEIARGKASGLHVEKHEHTGKDGAPIQTITTDMTPKQVKAIREMLNDQV